MFSKDCMSNAFHSKYNSLQNQISEGSNVRYPKGNSIMSSLKVRYQFHDKDKFYKLHIILLNENKINVMNYVYYY